MQTDLISKITNEQKDQALVIMHCVAYSASKVEYNKDEIEVKYKQTDVDGPKKGLQDLKEYVTINYSVSA